MKNKAKIQVVLLVILMLVSLTLTGAIFFLYQKAIETNNTLLKEKEDLLLRAQDAEKSIEDGQKAILELSNKLKTSQAQIETLSADLESLKESKEEALSEAVQLKMELEKHKSLKNELESKFAEAQGDLEKMQVKLSALESKKVSLEAKIKELEAVTRQSQNNDIELGKIVVTPESSIPQGPLKAVISEGSEDGISNALQGKVLVINKEYNFAVVNLGVGDGVTIGDIFEVYHDNQYIGDLKVEKVHDSMSAAGFESQAIKDRISEGDRVSAKIK